MEAVKKKRLAARTGNTLGYLATLLLQNQPRVEKEKERVNQAQYGAEMQAVLNEFLQGRAERVEESAEARKAEPERD